MNLKIAIQGIESSFHDLAVQQLFPSKQTTLVMCDSFEKVTTTLKNNQADYGVIAIENSIAGSILSNYNLIDNNNLKIIDESFLHIDMYLMALEGESLHSIDEVYSHPVALQQCSDYFKHLQPHCKIIEGKDTASEAKRIRENGLKGVAAIAGKQVAEKYGLKILGSKIQKIKENKTRFVVIGSDTNETNKKADKASLKFVLDHKVGSLVDVLQILSTFGINLTKIQSLPILGKSWQYSFFVDVLFNDLEIFTEVIVLLEKKVSELKVLGVYSHNVTNKPSIVEKVAL